MKCGTTTLRRIRIFAIKLFAGEKVAIRRVQASSSSKPRIRIRSI